MKYIRSHTFYTLVGMAVVGAALMPGYALSLDMVFGPNVLVPEVTRSSFLFYGFLKVLSYVVPVWVLQKGILVGIVVLAGTGMHGLLRRVDGRSDVFSLVCGGVFYVINPFTYSRFMAGQYAVLLGYALLPWYVRCLLAMGRQPSVKNALKLGLVTSAVAIVSIHTLVALAIITAAFGIVAVYRQRTHIYRLRRYIRPFAISAAVFAVINAIWLVPILTGNSRAARQIGQFGDTDIQAFATMGGNVLGRLIHIIHLQGFWAEARGLYVLPQNTVPLWGLLSTAVLLLVVYGITRWWQAGRTTAVALGIAAIVAVVFACGLADTLLGLPLLRGLREPHKLVGIVALVYGMGLAYAVQALQDKVGDRRVWRAGVAAVVMTLVLMFTRPMLWGFDGQLKAVDYPAGWYSVKEGLDHDKDNYTVLFLPWHQYMTYSFAGRLVANPAPHFFEQSVIVSQDPEFGGLQPDQQTRDIAALLHEGKDMPDFGQQLNRYRIKYIVVAHEYDYQKYSYLDNRQDIALAQRTKTMSLYRNNAWKE